jgi:hypothetical protein
MARNGQHVNVLGILKIINPEYSSNGDNDSRAYRFFRVEVEPFTSGNLARRNFIRKAQLLMSYTELTCI